MSSALWVLPSVDPDWRRACLSSLAPEIAEALVLVDNSLDNRGVAASWNVGRRIALEKAADWLVILSESVRFGAAAGRDWVDALGRADRPTVLQLGRCDLTCPAGDPERRLGHCRNGYGWHLAALRREALVTVGLFDEAFGAYFEDADYTRRLQLAGLTGEGWLGVVDGIDAHLAGTEHSVDGGFVTVDVEAVNRQYEAKWGGPPGLERFAVPYGP